MLAASAKVYRYVNEVGKDGWIQGLKEGPAGVLIPMCKYTKVLMLDTAKGRTRFTVQDGTYAGVTLSMKEENAKKYLGTLAPLNKLAQVAVNYGKYEEHWWSQARSLELDQQFATLKVSTITATVTMNSVWGTGFTPLPIGSYNIRVPDVPHAGNMTTYYSSVAPGLMHDQVWFPIEYGDNSRYVHVGNISDGCTTVVDIGKWASICEALVSHRSDDGKLVGKLIVTGKPERAK